jgi:anti-anti-sigma regulatory factor
MRNRQLTWKIEKRGDTTLIVFSGEVDETSDFTSLESLSGKVVFDLAGIRRMNSEGVRLWINFLKALGGVSDLSFVRCSLPVVTQINMVRGFRGKAEIRSFYAPYICEATGLEEERLLTREEVPDPLHPPTFPCEGGVQELDDIPERYFAFLLDSRP